MKPGASADHCHVSVIKKSKTRGRNRRFKLRRMKPVQKSKLQQVPDVGQEAAVEIPLSLPLSSSSDTLIEKDDFVFGKENGGSDVSAKLRVHSHSSMSVIGRRREMEDAVRVEIGFLEGFDFFGVYDGHGGPQVARACEERLHEVVASRVAAVANGGGRGEGMVMDWEKVMAEGFERMDGEVSEVNRTVGSTAVVAVVGKDEVVVANCGDSRAVMSRGGSVVIILSNDHKPNRPDELQRIEAAGGRVFNWNGHRVLGVLATSRSIGDQYLKPYVTSAPEITVTKRTEADEFLILASDGLWDVISNEFACHVVRRFLSGQARRKTRYGVVRNNNNNNPAMEAAEVLVQLAIARGSEDNISVIVVELNKVL